MNAGLVYMVCSVSVIVLAGLCAVCYLLGKGKNDAVASVLVVSAFLAVLGGFLPGMLWDNHCKRVELAENLFREHCEGCIVDWQHESVAGFKYRWVDSEGRLQETVLLENPWGEPVKVELK